MSVRGTPHASPWAQGAVRARLAGLALPRGWSAPAWAAIGVTALFIALTCWWLSQDSAMPYSDAAVHLESAFLFHDWLAEGNLLGPFRYDFIYPPLTPLVGALGIFVGGRSVGAPIVAENLVYLSALAVACYRIGKLAYGPWAGFLAVVFALGSPLIIEQFHVFMIDAPLAALVAVTVWLVLESDRFRRRDLALIAGVVAGLGLISKQSFPLYLPGLLLVVLLRDGGWRNWRGLLVFGLAALVVATPWYAYHASNLGMFTTAAGGAPSVPPLAKPPLLSEANVTWYFWGLANGLLFVPLLTFATIGLVSAAWSTVRRPHQPGVVPELLGGAVGAWAAITAMTHHDVRYTLPLIVYLAVLGSGWIVALPQPALRTAALAALGLAVVATTLGATFGVGPPSRELLPGNRVGPRGEGVMPLNHLTVYSNRNFMVSGPRREDDVLALLKDLRRDGITKAAWLEEWAPPQQVEFNTHGLIAFARIAELRFPFGTIDLSRVEPRQAVLIPERSLGRARPCLRLSEGQGVWIRLGDPGAPGARNYCPRFDPPVYGP